MRLRGYEGGAGGLSLAPERLVDPVKDTPVLGRGAQAGSSRLAFAGIYLFTLFLYLRPNDIFPQIFGTAPLAKIVAIIAILVYIGSKFSRGEPLSIRAVEVKLLGVIIALGALFIPIAVSRQDSIDMLTDTFLKVAIIFVLMINVVDTLERLLSIVKLVVVCGSVLALDAIQTYRAGEFTLKVNGVGTRISGLVGGMFSNPNDLAVALAILLPLAIALGVLSRGLARKFFFLCAAVLTLGVVVTFSRGGFLGLFGMAAVLVWKLGRGRRVTAIAVGTFAMGALLLLVPGYRERLSLIVHVDEDPTGSAQARRDIQKLAAVMALQHPVIGIGMGNFHIYSIRNMVAHNSYLEIANELGWAGFAAYLALILVPFGTLRRIERETVSGANGSADGGTGARRAVYYLSVTLQASFVAYMISSFFVSVQYQWYLYYLVAYAVALRQIHAAQQSVYGVAAAPPEATKPRGRLWQTAPGFEAPLTQPRTAFKAR